MPELPEVETIVRGLAPRLKNRRIAAVESTCPRVVLGDLSALVGRRIQSVRRAGKFIVLDLDSGPMTIHLGMTGKLLFDGQPGVHTRVVFTLDQGVLLYDDIRQFGRIDPSGRRLEPLGPEPLDLTPRELAARLRQRTAMIKPLLLNQRFLRGMGNIYTDEALHRAGVHPRSVASRLSMPRAERVARAVHKVLREAIERGGSSVSDYVDADGRRGSFQERHRVYGREGLPCPRCRTPIRRILVAQRGTHFCPRCQSK